MPRDIGKDPVVFKRETCRQCGTINEYAPGEVRTLWSGYDYGGGPDGAEGFSCVNCGKDVIVRRW